MKKARKSLFLNKKKQKDFNRLRSWMPMSASEQKFSVFF